jgi:hypothetical protein
LIIEMSDFYFCSFQALLTSTKLSARLVNVPGELSLGTFGERVQSCTSQR